MKLLFFMIISMKLIADDNNVERNIKEHPPKISFKEAVSMAYKHNIKLKQSYLHINRAKGQATAVNSAVLPQLSLHAHQELMNKRDPNHDNLTASAQVKIPLIDMKSFINIRAEQEAINLAQQQYNDDKNKLARDVILLYIKTLIALSLKDISLLEYELYEKQYNHLHRQSNISSIKLLTINKMAYLMNASRADYTEKNIDFLHKKQDLGQEIGIDGDFSIDTFMIESPLLNNHIEDLLLWAKNAPDMMIKKQDITSAQYALKGEYLGWLPKLYTALDSSIFPHRVNHRSDLSMMLIMDFPLLAGGGSLGAIKAKHALLAINELGLAHKYQEKKVMINQLYREMHDRLLAKNYAQLALNAASEAKDSAMRLLEAGLLIEGSIDVIEAIANLAKAKNQAIISSLTYEENKIKLLYAIGKINEII